MRVCVAQMNNIFNIDDDLEVYWIVNATQETCRFFWDSNLTEYLCTADQMGYWDIFEVLQFDDEALMEFFEDIVMHEVNDVECFKEHLDKMRACGVVAQGTSLYAGEWLMPNCLFERTDGLMYYWSDGCEEVRKCGAVRALF